MLRKLATTLASVLALAMVGCQGGHTSTAADPAPATLAGNLPPAASAADDEPDDAAPVGTDRRADDGDTGTSIDEDGVVEVRLADRGLKDDPPRSSFRQEIVTELPQPPPPDADPAPTPVIDDVYPSKGRASGGDRVQIRGKNLQAYLVLFGSVPARILDAREVDGAMTLTVAAPPARAGPAQVYLVVTNRDGRYAVASDRFQYFN
jgi:hypothetical protein